MIKPTILFLFGLRFFFYSDEHLPMHVHVKNGDGKAKIDILTAEVVENNGLKPADLKKAVDAVKQYKDDFTKAPGSDHEHHPRNWTADGINLILNHEVFLENTLRISPDCRICMFGPEPRSAARHY